MDDGATHDKRIERGHDHQELVRGPVNGGGNHQRVDHATNILVFSGIEGQMSSCVNEQTGADALSRSRRSPAGTYCFKTLLRRTNRVQHTKHRDSSDMAQALRRRSGQFALWS